MMKKTVLVVENDSFTREILHRRLKNAGYVVLTAENGVEALALVEEGMPDLILSDWIMPEMDGHELCRRIKETPGNTPTYYILLTSRDQQDDVVSALEAGADEYLIKPCDAKELLARVAAGIRIVGLQRELREANTRLNHALNQIDKELQVVADIQRALLPQDLPQVTGMRFAAYYRPSSLSGGDYYDVLPLRDGQLGIVIADVSGHGTPAMVAMALTRLLSHTHARDCSTPGEFLGTINRKLFEHLPTEQYVTMFYGILDPQTHVLRYSSAGQPAPLWWQAAKKTVTALENCQGFPLKLVQPDVTYDNWSVELATGDRLVLYTDGVTDCVNPEYDMFGSERLTESLLLLSRTSTGHSLDRLVEAMDEFSEGSPQMDDVTLLEILSEATPMATPATATDPPSAASVQ